MKRLVSLAIFAAFIMVFAQGAFAQSEVTFRTPMDTLKYTVQEFPSAESYFYLPYAYKTEFTIPATAKFFKINMLDVYGDSTMNFDVKFYYPGNADKKDTLIGALRVKSHNVTYSVPHKTDALTADTNIKVVIVNRVKSRTNKDFRFEIYSPVNPVNGVPEKVKVNE